MCWRASTTGRSDLRVIGAPLVAGRRRASLLVLNNRASAVDDPKSAGAGTVARSGQKKLRALFTGRARAPTKDPHCTALQLIYLPRSMQKSRSKSIWKPSNR